MLPVGLLTMPDTVTRLPGRAICGLIEVMATVTCGALAELAASAAAAPRPPGRGQRGQRHDAAGHGQLPEPAAGRGALTRHAGNGIAVLWVLLQVPGVRRISPGPHLPPTLNARARYPVHRPARAESRRGAAARVGRARAGTRPGVRPARASAGPGRRDGPGRVSRPRAQRPGPGHRRAARAGAGDRRGLGGPGVADRHRVRHGRAAQGADRLRGDHLPERDLPAGVPQAGHPVRHLAGGRPAPPRLHRQRDGRAAALAAAGRPVRRAARSARQGAAHPGPPGRLVHRRRAADHARGPVRGPARLRRGARGGGGHARAGRPGSAWSPPSGSATS